MQCNGKEIAVSGKLAKIARFREEWFEDIASPDEIVKALRDSKNKPDILTFWQRLPDGNPKHDYYMEWDNAAALKVTSFDNWWSKQIDSKTRNVARKAGKKGVEIRLVEFDDDLVNGIMGIFNESKIRQGKPFWHYGKKFERVKYEMSDRLHISEFIGAYFGGELIGFIKLLYADRYAMVVEILSKIAHRDKSPTNALLCKAVETCAEKNLPHLVYAKWSDGSLGDFKRNNGFEKIDLPRYFIPITLKGNILLRLKLHHGISGVIPQPAARRIKEMRKKWYSRSETSLVKVKTHAS